MKSIMRESTFSIGNQLAHIQSKSVNDFFVQKAITVKDFAYKEDQNSRPYMEDGFFAKDDLLNDGQVFLFGVFDGHGGRVCVDYLAKAFPYEFAQLYVKNGRKNIEQIFSTLYAKLDQDLQQKFQETNEQGCTACIGLIRYEGAQRVLYISNVGDSQAVIFEGNTLETLTEEHKPTNNFEQLRIIKGGGKVFNGRVCGQLAVSRAFGDFFLKKEGVIVQPFIAKRELRKVSQYLILASDGVWDGVSKLQQQQMIKQLNILDNSKEIANYFVSTALQNGSLDNICCLVIKLN